MLREARREDVPLIVAMLADDDLGQEREQLADMTPYLRALDLIQGDPHNWQYVWDENGEVLRLPAAHRHSRPVAAGRMARADRGRAHAGVSAAAAASARR